MDWRGLLAALPEDERAAAAPDGPPPALGQVWAAGFMAAVDHWADDWAPPRDKEIAESMADAVDCIAELLEGDRAAPAMNLYDEVGPPSVSEARFDAFGEAIWAVYDLHDIARSLGPRIAPARSANVNTLQEKKAPALPRFAWSAAPRGGIFVLGRPGDKKRRHAAPHVPPCTRGRAI